VLMLVLMQRCLERFVEERQLDLGEVEQFVG
jgi:hypothetical protein